MGLRSQVVRHEWAIRVGNQDNKRFCVTSTSHTIVVGESAPNEFALLKALLEKIELLPTDEAAVYAEAVRKGSVTTSDAARVSHQDRSKAGVTLRRLAEKGYVRERVREAATRGGRGHGDVYSVLPPKEALKEKFEAFENLRDLANRLDQHLELLAGQGERDEDVWRLDPPALFATIVASIGSAAVGIEIVSNDCSWIERPDVLTGLEDAKKRGLRTTVYATALRAGDRSRLRSCGLTVKTIKGKIQPFLLVDRRVLFVPVRMGSIATDYGALQTSNRYMLDNHSAMIDEMNEGRKYRK